MPNRAKIQYTHSELRDIRPVDRLNKRSGDALVDEIRGILVGFVDIVNKCGGCVPLTAMQDSVEEIKDLLERHTYQE